MTQKEFVIAQLKESGEVTRNFCLANRITRLGSIACLLKANGWQLGASRRGRDYVYTLVEAPKRAVYTYEERVLTDGSIVRVPHLTYQPL